MKSWILVREQNYDGEYVKVYVHTSHIHVHQHVLGDGYVSYPKNIKAVWFTRDDFPVGNIYGTFDDAIKVSPTE